MDDNDALVDSLKTTGKLYDESVETALRRVDRIVFIDTRYADQSYVDKALPGKLGRLAPAPGAVIALLQNLAIQKGMRCLVVGPAAAYLCAILAEMVGHEGEVYLIESDAAALALSKKQLSAYANVRVVIGVPMNGLRSKAPFDRVAVAAGVATVPPLLVDQLGEGGRIVFPLLRGAAQRLSMVRRIAGHAQKSDLGQTCSFPSIQ